MAHLLEDNSLRYTAVINYEEQYSLWPVTQEPPSGWSRVGPEGSRQDVLTFIDSVWVDLRPRSLREAMSERSATRSAES
jgi:MbtH protein